jgi:cell division GTPase FtsZ
MARSYHRKTGPKNWSDTAVVCITDLIVKEGLINLDFADVQSVMSDRPRIMMAI